MKSSVIICTLRQISYYLDLHKALLKFQHENVAVPTRIYRSTNNASIDLLSYIKTHQGYNEITRAEIQFDRLSGAATQR
jgi:hypothetical protein